MNKEYPTTDGKQLELVANTGVYAKATRRAAMKGARRPRLLEVTDLVHAAGPRGMTRDEISQAMGLPVHVLCGPVLTLLKDGQLVETARLRKTRLGAKATVLVDVRHECMSEVYTDEP